MAIRHQSHATGPGAIQVDAVDTSHKAYSDWELNDYHGKEVRFRSFRRLRTPS